MIIPEGFAQITYRFTGTGLPNGADIVFGVSNDADLSASALAASVGNCFTTGTMNARLCSDVVLSTVIAKLGPEDTGPMHAASFAVPGAQVASAVTPAVSVLVRKATALGGRRGRGRMFWPGASDSSFDDAGVMPGATNAAWMTSLADFLGDLAAGNFPMVLLHSPPTEWVLVNGQPRRVPIAGSVPSPTLVTALTVDGRAATQRRRQRG